MSFNERLIELVRQNPCIYTSSSRKHKDVIRKQDTWKSISEQLGTSVKACKTRWRTLKDSFIRKKKEADQAKTSGAAHAFIATFEHYDALTFLLDHLKHKETIGNLTPVIITESGTESGTSSQDPFDDQGIVEENMSSEEILVEDEPSEADNHPSQFLPPTTRKESQPSTVKIDLVPVLVSSMSGPTKSKRKRSDRVTLNDTISNALQNNMKAIHEVSTALSQRLSNKNEFGDFGNFVASSLSNMPKAVAYEKMAAITHLLGPQTVIGIRYFSGQSQTADQ